MDSLINTGNYKYVLVNDDCAILVYADHRQVLIELIEVIHKVDPDSKFEILKVYEATPESIAEVDRKFYEVFNENSI